MTRLERIIKGFNEYDKLCSTYIDDTDETISRRQLCELRHEVSLLIGELKRFGCRKEKDK
jgi:hypothetical protein